MRAEDEDILRVLDLGGATKCRGNRMRWLLWSAVVLIGVLLLAGLFPWPADGTVRYRTEPARIDHLTVIVSTTGELQPVNEVEVGTEISGILDEVSADFNDPVEDGQLLARVNTDKLRAQAEQARASLDSAEAKLLEAEANVLENRNELDRLNRVRELSDGKLPSLHDLDVAEASLKRSEAAAASARAQIAEVRASLEAIELDISKASIRAPITGIVLNRHVDPGQTVAASFQTPVLFTIAEDLSCMELSVDIDEADVGQVNVGQQATFTVDAFPDRIFEAQVIEVRYAPESVEGVVTYETLLSVDNGHLLLRPGMTANVDIIVNQVEKALLVANAALRFTPPEETKTEPEGEKKGGLFGGLLPPPPGSLSATPAETTVASGSERTVWMLDEGQAVPLRITTGLSDGTMTEVVAGDLRAGQQLLVDVLEQ